MRAGRRHKNRVAASPKLSEARARVQELEETLLAIKSGRVDAVVVDGPDGDQVFTLQGAEHPYRVLVETMTEGAATLNPDGTILYANASFAAILGIPLEDVIASSLPKLFADHEHDKIRTLIEDAFRGESRGELDLLGPDGKRRLVRFSLSPVNGFELRTICVVATDLTELSEANEALRASEDVLRGLSGRLLRLQDEERRRISRDLHDVTGQKLALLSMDLSGLIRSKKIAKDEEVHRLLSEALALSNGVNEEIRTLSYVLHPPLLDELGLSSAVEWFAQGFEQRTGICVTLDIPNNFVRLPPDAEVALFRIVQESLTNVHRYSGSATAFVRARSESGKVRLEIGDFGKGINNQSKIPGSTVIPTLGVGIQGMKERLRQLSGALEITSQPNLGTLVTAILPFRSQCEDVSEPAQFIAEQEGQPAPEKEISGRNGWRRRILIADDHDVLRRGIKTMIESDPGLEVCGEAVDGRDAVEKILTHAPDLVILDINMPFLNGLDVVRQVVRHGVQTKILAFSVHDSPQIVAEIIAAGAHGYLSKATAGQDLLHKVNLLLSRQVQSQLA